MKCSGKFKDGTPCSYTVSDNRFCKTHSYLEKYDLEKCTHCATCKRWIDTGSNKTCSDCLEIGKKNREKQKEKYIQCDICIESKCKIIYKSTNKLNSGKLCCNKHYSERYIWLDGIDKDKKPCYNDVRGCRTLLNKYSDEIKCDKCKEETLDKSKKYEVIRKNKREEAQNKELTCKYCYISYNDAEEFIDYRGNKTVRCKKCREIQKIRERKAIKEGRKHSYPMSELTKKKKINWGKMNPTKRILYHIRRRAKMMRTMDDAYWEENAKQQLEWREKLSDEQWLEYNNKKKISIIYKISSYKYKAKDKNLEWNITDELAEELFEGNCFYCGIISGKYHSGIDRINNREGYTERNTVSCCRMCNIMKGVLDVDNFLKKCEHILTYLGKIDGKMYSNIFKKRFCVTYESYIARAEYKNINFIINKEDYYNLINGKCYLCGTETYCNHINGIDRVSSNEGYTLDNCKTCCSSCNHMKNMYEYDSFVDKLYMIWNKHIKEQKITQITNDIDMFCGEINIYIPDIVNKKIVRTDYYIPNMILGKWSIKYEIDNDIVCVLISDKHIDCQKNDTIIIDIGKYSIPYILLSQSHNKYKKYDDNLIFNSLTYDSDIILPFNNKKIYFDIYCSNKCITKIIVRKDIISRTICGCYVCEKHFDENKNVCMCVFCIKHSILTCKETFPKKIKLYAKNNYQLNKINYLKCSDFTYLYYYKELHKNDIKPRVIDYEHRKNMIVKWNDIEWQKQHVEDVFNKQLMKNIIKV
jgi:hypothetical protein